MTGCPVASTGIAGAPVYIAGARPIAGACAIIGPIPCAVTMACAGAAWSNEGIEAMERRPISW